MHIISLVCIHVHHILSGPDPENNSSCSTADMAYKYMADKFFDRSGLNFRTVYEIKGVPPKTNIPHERSKLS